MKKLIATSGLSREEWLAYRRLGIGGSDAAAVCGANPYSSPIEVYLDKTGKISDDLDNEAMRQGRDLEDYVARRFMEATELKVRRANAIYYDEERPYMLADADRLVVGEKAGLECKTVSPYSADLWKDGAVPVHYQIQCYHYMSVFQVKKWYIAALILGKEFVIRELTFDEEIIGNIRRMEEQFWKGFVEKGVLPEPDGTEASERMIRGQYQRAEQGKSILLSGFGEKLGRRQELASQMESLDREKKKIEQELKLYLGDAETAEGEGYLVSWKNVASNRLDTERLKAELPEVYEAYQKQQNTRRLSVKAA